MAIINEPDEKSYLAVALDPVHFGAGGYRIGRVDNSIIREPGTNLPKGAGTTLKGCIKFCADIRLREDLPDNNPENHPKKEKLDSCAGTRGCGKNNCPICYTFGYSKEDKNFEGSVNIYDAHIAFFPIYSNEGPKWITTEKILRNFFQIELKKETEITNHKVTAWQYIELSTRETTSEIASTVETNPPPQKKIRLGWLYLPVKKVYFEFKEKTLLTKLKEKYDYSDIIDKIIIVPYEIFSHLVNSNLEVRTSNAINPETGAAEEGALFTYEALPALTVFKFDTVLNKYRKTIPVRDVTELGMYDLRFYGVGGMTSRGFGRLDVILDKTGNELYNNIIRGTKPDNKGETL